MSLKNAALDCWIFDLDNTLYPRTCRLFDQIDVLITNYVVQLTGLERAEARKKQKDYVKTHGTTLNGLMATTNIDPDDYLHKVHDIDYSPVAPNIEMMKLIAQLPGRKFIYTNGSTNHALSVLEKLGDPEIFDGIFAIKEAQYQPKPLRQSYDLFLGKFNIDPTRAIMFEDMQVNLKTAHQSGMKTVHIVPPKDYKSDHQDHHEFERADDQPHIDYVSDDITAFLRELTG